MSRASRFIVASVLWLAGCEGILNDPSGPGSTEQLASTAQGGNTAAGCGKGTRVALRSLTPLQYENSVRDLFDGQIAPSTSFPRPSGAAVTGFSTDVSVNALNGTFAEGVASAAEETALAVMDKLDQVLPCAAQKNRSCAEQFIDKYGRRGLRRALAKEQRDKLLALYDSAMADHGDFQVAIAELTSAILQMPEFVYLPEVGTEVAKGVLKLDDFELASRLSYLLWDTLPDDKLLAAAEAGKLASDDGLKAEVERLMADARFEKVVQKFVREWTNIRLYQEGDKDPEQFPNFDASLASAIQEELDRFVTQALRQGNGGYQALLKGRDTFVNGPLAELYGISGGPSSESDWQKVTLGPERPGLITRAAVLSGLSGDAIVSHVKRGKFVRMGLLCSQLGAPPANAMAMQPDYAGAMTRREKSEILQQTSPCGGCHVQLDRIGLALDDFDAIGRHLPDPSIDVSGEILAGGDTSGAFHGAAELAERLANSETVRECVVKHWFRYSFGRREDTDDTCATDGMSQSFSTSGDNLAMLFASVAQTDGFRYRKLSEVSP